LDERKMLLSQTQSATLAQYNAQHSQRIYPAILLVIDNFAEFRETFVDLMEASFTSLMRDGRAYGIHIVCSAEQMTAIPSKIYNLFSERIALRLADIAEYSGVVGRGVSEMPEMAGRGFVRPERIPLEFQAALPNSRVKDQNEDSDGDIARLARIVGVMREEWQGNPPEKIEILPAVVPLRSLEADPKSRATTIGLRDIDLSLAQIDLRNRGPHFTIIGPPLSGKTTTLRTWLIAKAHTSSVESVSFVLVDFQRRLFQYGGERNLGEIPHVIATVSDMTELEQAIEQLTTLFNQRRSARRTDSSVIMMIDDYDNFASTLNANRSMYTRLADLLRQFSNDGLHFVTAGLISSIRTNDELMKQIVASRYGLALDDSDSVMALGGRLKRSAAAELPTGRGYLVKSGLVEMIQVATPQGEGEDMEHSLDTWVAYLTSYTKGNE
jgi:S-DNA-T family DNA segregation ATPase FtsK/SpoIIIE